jgi:hypothetical protein
MNKAFVRESDEGGGRCPKCGSLGVSVESTTLTAMIRAEARNHLGDSAFFCEFARCEVAYFDAFDRTVTAEQLVVPVWPKDPAAPLCGCFGLSADDIEADVREGGVTRVKEAVARSKSPAASCLTKSPTGRSCAAAIQRYYFKLREGAAP